MLFQLEVEIVALTLVLLFVELLLSLFGLDQFSSGPFALADLLDMQKCTESGSPTQTNSLILCFHFNHFLCIPLYLNAFVSRFLYF